MSPLAQVLRLGYNGCPGSWESWGPRHGSRLVIGPEVSVQDVGDALIRKSDTTGEELWTAARLSSA